MLARMARVVPAIFMWSVDSAPSWTLPLSLATVTPAGLAIVRVPFGPFTDRTPSASFSSTPFGRLMTFLATRDMGAFSLGDEAEDFATDARGAGLAVGHQTLRGGDDRHAEAGEDARQLVLALVLAQAGTRNALEALDHRLAFVVLQRDLEFCLGGRHGNLRLADGERILDAHQHVGDGISHAHFCCLLK